jgi:hypothetical protein
MSPVSHFASQPGDFRFGIRLQIFFFIRTTHFDALMRNRGCRFSRRKDLGKTWAKNRPQIGSESVVEGCKSSRINNKLD